MKLTLINVSCKQKKCLGDTWYLPLGLVHVASALELAGMDVEVVDGVLHLLFGVQKDVVHGHGLVAPKS